jgi:hypothetical protein
LSVQIARIETRLDGVEGDVKNLDAKLEQKHRENRASIHELRNGQQTTHDLIHKLDLKLAHATGYAIGAGATVAVLFKLIDHIWK